MKAGTRKFIRIVRDIGYAIVALVAICMSIGGIILLDAEWMPGLISWTLILAGGPLALLIFFQFRKDRSDDNMQDLHLESEANTEIAPMVNQKHLCDQ